MLKKGIKQKLVLSLVITTLLVMSIFFIILDRYIKDYSIGETQKNILFLGENASVRLQRHLFYTDYSELDYIINSIMPQDFDYLVIFDNSTRNVAYSMGDKRITGALRWRELLKDTVKPEIQQFELKGRDYTHYLFPVFSTGVKKPLGHLVIGILTEKMHSKLAGITTRILLISVLLFISLTLTIYFLSDRIVKPIKELSEKIDQFSSGDYSVRSAINTGDEIGDLSHNFNIMADTINEQILSIEKYSKNLEKMVEERTRELSEALEAIKEKDTKLSHAEKINNLNSLVSAIAHEINNPLAIISGNIQLIQGKTQDPVIRKKLKTADDAIERIAKLIDEINFFSAIKDISSNSLSFGHLLDGVVQQVVPEDIPVHIDGTRDDRIESNVSLLSTSMENILKNSVEMILNKNPGKKGKIVIRYFREGSYLAVDVIDNAGGFEDLTKVFDPFYTTFSQKKGLGLTFAYHAVQALNGEIKIENVDDGARVRVMLPTRLIQDINISNK
jgi:signal transduction histidine kinase